MLRVATGDPESFGYQSRDKTNAFRAKGISAIQDSEVVEKQEIYRGASFFFFLSFFLPRSKLKGMETMGDAAL